MSEMLRFDTKCPILEQIPAVRGGVSFRADPLDRMYMGLLQF